MKVKTPRIARTTVYLGLLGFLTLAAVVFAGALPEQRRLKAAGTEADALAQRISEHEKLMPAYALLVSANEAVKKQGVAITPLPNERIQEFSEGLSESLRKAGMKAGSFTPDVLSLVGQAKALAVNGFGQGSLKNCREFLVLLAETPHVSRVERVEIKETLDGKELRVRVSANLK